MWGHGGRFCSQKAPFPTAPRYTLPLPLVGDSNPAATPCVSMSCYSKSGNKYRKKLSVVVFLNALANSQHGPTAWVAWVEMAGMRGHGQIASVIVNQFTPSVKPYPRVLLLQIILKIIQVHLCEFQSPQRRRVV